MKKFLVLGMLVASICSCHDGSIDKMPETPDYDSTVETKVNQMVKPVTLIGKDKSFGLYGVTLKGGDGTVFTIGNFSIFANQIGASRQIGDTIR